MPARLSKALIFPPVESANKWGMLAVGGDLSTERLLLAYRSGIFPWGGEPVRWYAPDPRCVVYVPDAKDRLPQRLMRSVRKERFEIRYNTAFDRVIRECAAPAPGREETWLSDDMIDAYCRLHREGHAHSVECRENGELVGGLYGVTVGGLFSGESMFHRRRDASKIAFAALLGRLEQKGFVLLDCQLPTSHLLSLGAWVVSRDQYMKWLSAVVELDCRF